MRKPWRDVGCSRQREICCTPGRIGLRASSRVAAAERVASQHLFKLNSAVCSLVARPRCFSLVLNWGGGWGLGAGRLPGGTRGPLAAAAAAAAAVATTSEVLLLMAELAFVEGARRPSCCCYATTTRGSQSPALAVQVASRLPADLATVAAVPAPPAPAPRVRPPLDSSRITTADQIAATSPHLERGGPVAPPQLLVGCSTPRAASGGTCRVSRSNCCASLSLYSTPSLRPGACSLPPCIPGARRTWRTSSRQWGVCGKNKQKSRAFVVPSGGRTLPKREAGLCHSSPVARPEGASLSCRRVLGEGRFRAGHPCRRLASPCQRRPAAPPWRRRVVQLAAPPRRRRVVLRRRLPHVGAQVLRLVDITSGHVHGAQRPSCCCCYTTTIRRSPALALALQELPCCRSGAVGSSAPAPKVGCAVAPWPAAGIDPPPPPPPPPTHTHTHHTHTSTPTAAPGPVVSLAEHKQV